MERGGSSLGPVSFVSRAIWLEEIFYHGPDARGWRRREIGGWGQCNRVLAHARPCRHCSLRAGVMVHLPIFAHSVRIWVCVRSRLRSRRGPQKRAHLQKPNLANGDRHRYISPSEVGGPSWEWEGEWGRFGQLIELQRVKCKRKRKKSFPAAPLLGSHYRSCRVLERAQEITQEVPITDEWKARAAAMASFWRGGRVGGSEGRH